MRLPCIFPLLVLLAAGCDKNPAKAVPPVESQQKAWIGTYLGGSLVLDLVQTGSKLSGEIVFGSTDPAHLWLLGTMGADSMVLALDPSHGGTPGDFSFRAQSLVDGTLSGTITHVSSGLAAGVTGRALTRRTIDTDVTHNVSLTVKAMEYDGSRLWLSTVGDDYVRIDSSGTIVDTIAIYRNFPTHWTSSELMFDGALLWGAFPITISGPGGLTNVADLLAFTAAGRAPDSLRIGHRPAGLAHDGTHVWSLGRDPAALLRIDGTGAVSESLHVGIPDAIHLVHDGARFWTVGWFLKRLYEVDATGEVVSICDLPSAASGSYPGGLAWEGSHIWYSEGLLGGLSTLHRMTIQ